MANKKHKHKRNYRMYAYIFFSLGIAMISVSWILNFLFIDEDFKEEYRAIQYNECIERKTDKEVCESQYGDK